MTHCPDALTVYDDQVQAFCANTWCKPNAEDSSKSTCDVKEGPFLTASKYCGPDERGRLPNGAPVEAGTPGLLARANDILKIMQSSSLKTKLQ